MLACTLPNTAKQEGQGNSAIEMSMLSHMGYTKTHLSVYFGGVLQNLVNAAGSAFIRYEIILIC